MKFNILITLVTYILELALIIGLNLSDNALITPIQSVVFALIFTGISIFMYDYLEAERKENEENETRL